MSAGNSGDGFRELEQAYGEYTVYDQHYEKLGKVDHIFVDGNDQPEYIGVKTGFLGMKSTLIPIELVRVNDRRKLVEVAADVETIKHAPTFEDDNDITPEYEDRVHGYFGLERPPHMQSSGGYYDSSTEAAQEAAQDEDLRRSVDTEYGERAESPERPEETAPPGESDAPLGDPDAHPDAHPSREEPAANTDPVDADAATRTGGDTRDEIEVQDDRNMRVFKRARDSRP